MNVKRVLLKFEKESGKLISEYEIKGIELSELRALFNERDDDLMFHSYDVTERQKERLEKAIGNKINLELFDYCADVYTLKQ